jgi:glycosyltransferase involved in cell wall biosynthesis
MRKIVGDAGVLVPPSDAKALADAIVEQARRDPEARRVAARTRFESALSYDHVGRELRRAYETMIR